MIDKQKEQKFTSQSKKKAAQYKPKTCTVQYKFWACFGIKSSQCSKIFNNNNNNNLLKTQTEDFFSTSGT